MRLPATVLPALLPVLLLVLLSACSPLQALNAISSSEGLRVEEGVKYGDGPRQTLDLYVPRGASDLPAVVFAHGGSFRSGSKEQYAFVGRSLARAGYVVAVIDYRLAPDFVYPAFVRDTALAVRWLHDNADEYGGDPNVLFVMGYSAGGFNAMEAVMNERWLSEVGVPIDAVRGVVGLAGPYDYDFRGGNTGVAFPENAMPAEVMPARHVRDDPPPALLVTAELDTVVEPRNVERMAAALRAEGGEVRVVEIQNVNHATLIGTFAVPLSGLSPVRQVVIDFLEKWSPEDRTN